MIFFRYFYIFQVYFLLTIFYFIKTFWKNFLKILQLNFLNIFVFPRISKKVCHKKKKKWNIDIGLDNIKLWKPIFDQIKYYSTRW